MRCPCHKPKPAVEGQTEKQRALIFLSWWRDVVRCEWCGMFGLVSHGRRRSGRPPRITWLRRPEETEKRNAELAAYRQAIGL